MRHLLAAGLTVCLVLAGCASCAPAPIPPPTVIAPAAEILPGEGLGFEPAPAGTPPPNPKLYLHVAPRDETTREPVDEPVTVLLGGRILGKGLREYTFELPGSLLEPTELAVEVPG